MKCNNIGLILLSVHILLFPSCDDKSNRVADVVEYWIGREINLPDSIVDAVTGDTIDLSSGDFTILTYIDSDGCTSCKMKLSLWNEFLQSVDSTSLFDVNSLIVADYSKQDEIIQLAKRDGYHYPVYSDINNQTYKNNKFCTQQGLNTLLLNSNRKVLLIGSPIDNLRIREIFLDILKGNHLVSDNGRIDVHIENSVLDLGSLHSGDRRRNVVKIFNQGNDTLRIRDIITSCKCTTATVEDGTIPPKGYKMIDIEMFADSLNGEFTRSVQIFYEGLDMPSNIEIIGSIVE